MKVKYLDLEEILRIHYQLIEDFGGSHGIRDQNRLKSVLEAPKMSVFGQEQYPDIYLKAAVYLRNIIADHPFLNGNKRTALTVCGIFLARNGKPIRVSPKLLEDFTVSIAVNHTTIEEIAQWLKG
jgi:death-on-curing protein